MIGACLNMLLQTGSFSVYGQDDFTLLGKSENVNLLPSDNYLSGIVTSPFGTSEISPVILRALPDEEDPEFIGIDQVPVENAIPFILILIGLYILICIKHRKKTSFLK